MEPTGFIRFIPRDEPRLLQQGEIAIEDIAAIDSAQLLIADPVMIAAR